MAGTVAFIAELSFLGGGVFGVMACKAMGACFRFGAASLLPLALPGIMTEEIRGMARAAAMGSPSLRNVQVT